MITSNKHIISTCHWNTFFDKKEMGATLQSRLSSWSNLNMPGELANIFDKICPPEQVWKIQSLTIDLGQISYNELESALSLRLRKQVSKRLADLLLYRNEGEEVIEIMDEDTLYIKLLCYFFQNGIIPWNFKDFDGSVNLVLTGQLQKNREKVISMLREIGAMNVDVRKRIVWQTNEANIIKIIEGLEPNNSQQVISFLDELGLIQSKGVIVQASNTDFRKNVCFWILNYLLAERGSIFNKVAFIKSNLNQLAAHYHINYTELINLIEQAIEKVKEHSIIRGDILLSIGILVSESKNDDFKNKHNLQDTDIRMAIENYFSGSLISGEPYASLEVNDLVLSITNNKEFNFSQLLSTFSNKGKLLDKKLSSLNEYSLDAIFSSIIKNIDEINGKDINYLKNICKQLNVEERFFGEIAIKSTITNNSLPIKRIDFLDRLVTELANKARISRWLVLERLLCADVPPGNKTLSSLDYYSDLSLLFATEISGDNMAVTTKRFKELLNMLGLQVRKNTIEKPVFIALRKPVVQYIRLNPAGAFKALVEYRHKRTLKKLLPYLMDKLLTNQLMRNSKNNSAEALLSLNDVMQKAGTPFASLIEKAVAQVGLDVIFCEPQGNAREAIERILEKIALAIPSSQLEGFFEMLEKWLLNSKIPSNIIRLEFVTEMKLRMMPKQKQSLLQQVANLLQKPGNEYSIRSLLSVNFEAKDFASFRKINGKQQAEILNYLIKDGESLMVALVKKYVLILKNKPTHLSESKITASLREHYWKCILDVEYYSGNIGTLRKLYDGTIFTIFNTYGTEIRKTVGGLGNATILLNGEKFTSSQFFSLIEQNIQKAQDYLNYNGQSISLEKILLIGLETKPAELLRIIKNIVVSNQRIATLNRAISFNQFCLLIANGAGGGTDEAITSIRMLFTFTERITSGRISEKLLYSYWTGVWTIIRTGNLKPIDLKNLVAETLYQLAVEKNLSSDFILSEIGKLSFQFTNTLKTAFAGYNAVFVVLLANKTPRLSRELRRIKQNGTLYSLSYHIITSKKIPLCFFYADDQKTASILNEIIAHAPVNLLIVLKREMVSEQQIAWLHDHLNFPQLINSVITLNQNRHVVLNDFGQLYNLIDKIAIPGVSVREIRFLMFRKLLLAWTTNNWVAISGEPLLKELIWDICIKNGTSKQQFLFASEKITPLLPLSLQLGFKHLKKQEKKMANNNPDILKSAKGTVPKWLATSQTKQSVFVKNAGLALVNNYIPMLLERLNLLDDKKLMQTEAKEKAVNYLQYVVTGLNNTEEYLLPLNKIMCGLPLSHPVDREVALSEEQNDIVDGLIKSMIAHWPSIGKHTIHGFRGNWLVRDGVLTELDNKWELKVEKRAYDILLNKAPFSFSIIKYPWMDKPIHVTWSY